MPRGTPEIWWEFKLNKNLSKILRSHVINNKANSMIYKYAYAYKTNPNYLSFYSAKSIYLKILLVNFLKY